MEPTAPLRTAAAAAAAPPKRRKASRRTADEVRRHLHDQILNGEIVAGQRIDLDVVAEELEVSRTPVREALLQLESEGLVDRVPYRGVVVSGVDLSVVEEVLALRLQLEGLAARVGVSRLDAADIARMEALLAQLSEIRTETSDPAYAFNQLNHEFHGLLYLKAGTPILIRFIEVLATQADRIRLHYNVKRENKSVEEQHARILRACIAGDPDEVADAVRSHILAVVRLFMELLPEMRLDEGSPLWQALTPKERETFLSEATA